jgi:fumarylacetoacetase
MTKSWIEIPTDSDFSLANLPWGVFSPSKNNASPRCATILGDTVIDLSVLEEAGLFQDIDQLDANTFNQPTLNAFIEHPAQVWNSVRQRLFDLFRDDNMGDSFVRYHPNLRKAAFYPVNDNGIKLHLPIQVQDYTDFYSSREHATNVGTMFRGPDNALQPNWLHLPVGYHGRSSTVFITGTQIHRPMGQLQKDPNDEKQGSIHGPCRLMDFELEVAAVVGGPSNVAGHTLTMQQAKTRIFGYLLMNDWSARDIQKWEYVPLGPFTSKNFATTVSPWIVSTTALEPFTSPTSAGNQVDPTPLPYLIDPEYASYGIDLTVGIQGENQTAPATVCRSNFTNLYWNAAQQLVHHSVTGCVMQAGDLLGSGTISGSSPDAFGSMLELSWKGTKEVVVGDEVRKFLKDGDTVVMKGFCDKTGHGRVGFGECTGKVLPALTAVVDDKGDKTKEEVLEIYSDFKLHGYWRSSSTWRVRVALAAKGISYETIPINILEGEQKAEEYLAKNPLGQVPLLEVTDRRTGQQLYLSQSIAIIEFLDEAFPARRSLLPKDPQERAIAREMVELINAGTQPLQNVVLLRELEEKSEGKINAAERSKAVNEHSLIALEVLVKRHRTESSGPYCLGSYSPTVVDAVLVPQMFNARRFGVDVTELCPELVAIETECLGHPWFQTSHPGKQPDAQPE